MLILKPFQLVRQRDSMECGVACLSMVCKYYGVKVSLNSIRKICQSSIDGVSMKGIVDAAHALGFQSYGAKIQISALYAAKKPVVLHWNQNHFVVLYKVDCKGRFFWIADPGKGKYKLNLDEFVTHWISLRDNGVEKGIALFFEPKNLLNDSAEFSDQDARSFTFLWNYVIRFRKYFVLIVLGLLIGCVLQLILPFLTQCIVDIGIENNDIALIWLILLGELMIVAGRTANDFIRRWLLLHISMRINITLVSDFFIKLLKLPMSFFDTKLMGDLLQRIGDHSRVQSFLTNQVISVLFTMLNFIVFGIVLLVYDYLIFSTFLLGSLVYGLWIVGFLSRRKVLDYELFEQQAINQNKTYQFITSMQEIKLQDCERRRRWEWEDTQADLFQVQMKSLKLQQVQEAGCIFINEIKNILITFFAATSVIDGQITLGAMLAIQYIVGQLNSPVEQLMQFILSLQDVKISLERINEIHTAKNEEENDSRIHEYKGEKAIDVEHVSFKYDYHALKNTLTDVSFTIPEGKVTAIVGASGSGKTTLIKLMLGYYPVLSGKIRIATININGMNLKWWRRHCGVVMQDGVIFSESIARNIAVDDGDVNVELLQKAARIACIHDFVMALPLKYDTRIGCDGIGLSQGQKQRILIARAVYKNPDFIFLDEATNALDAHNERAIVENLADFNKGRTVVVVAHRLSTVKNADQIIVVDSGKITEIGNHISLIKRRGTYYNLIKNQLELGV